MVTNNYTINLGDLPRDPFPRPFKGLRPVLKDLLKVLREYPAYVENVHSAFNRLNARGGIDLVRTQAVQRMTGNENLTAFNNITAQFYGIEEAAYEILVDYALQASMGGRTRKKALVVIGAPGAGKSDFINFQERHVMRSREPIPVLKYGINWVNPLNALYLARLIAETKSGGIYDDTVEALTQIIDELDLSGDSELNPNNPKLAQIMARHGIAAGSALTSADLAEICMVSERDFVQAICYGLDLPSATVDALYPSASLIDPFVKDVVLGRFFGAYGPSAPAQADWSDELAKTNKPQSKKRSHPTYGAYDARYAVTLAEFPLVTMSMSKGEGIVDVAEVEPINFDLAVWRGKLSLVNMGTYESNDPRILSLSGNFNKGKFIVLTEGLRNPPEAFRILLEALEGQRVSLPDGFDPSENPDGIGFEGMVVIHSNNEQWQKFSSNPAHLAHLDRFRVVTFKYPLEASASEQVTAKLYNASNFGRPAHLGGVHHEPLAFRFIGHLAAATHLDMASKDGRPLLAVLRAYDGKQVRERMMGTYLDLRALRERAPWSEGMTGLSPREIDDIIGQLAAEALSLQGTRKASCFTTAEVRDRLIQRFRNNPAMNKKDRDLWIGWLSNEFETFRRQELTKVYKAAFIPAYKDLCTQVFRKYINYVRAITLGVRPTNTAGGQTISQRDMEAFLQEIERSDENNISSAQAPKFRAGVMAAVSLYGEDHPGADLPYEVHEGLKTCIESYVLRQSRDVVSLVGVTNISPDDQQKIDSAKQRLIHEHGYCEYCAGKLLIEVALTSDFLKA